jgi:hypothetical protein
MTVPPAAFRGPAHSPRFAALLIRRVSRPRTFQAWNSRPAREGRNQGRPFPSGLDNENRLLLGDRVAFVDQDLDYRPRDRGDDRDFHLHRFDDRDLLLFLDGIANCGLDLPHIPGDFGFNDDAAHILVSSACWGLAPVYCRHMMARVTLPDKPTAACVKKLREGDLGENE